MKKYVFTLALFILLIFLLFEIVYAQECKEIWLCYWTTCREDGYSYAFNCTDLSHCGTMLNKPTKKSCIEAGFCKERWECEWSECKADGYRYAQECLDKNACNTTFLKPVKEKCMEKEEKKPEEKPEEKIPVPEGCIPEWECEEAACKVIYNINGVETRKEKICYDKSGCMPSKIEGDECIEKKDIETKTIFGNETQSVEIIDKESKSIVARIEYGERKGKPYLDVSFVALPSSKEEKLEKIERKKFPFISLLVISSLVSLFLILLLFFFKKGKKITEKTIPASSGLENEALKRLKKINTKKKNAFEDFEWVFRVFLKNFFNIKYEFTHEELTREIERKKIPEELKEEIVSLSQDIYDIKYGGKKDKKNIGKMITRARKIIKSLLEKKGL